MHNNKSKTSTFCKNNFLPSLKIKTSAQKCGLSAHNINTKNPAYFYAGAQIFIQTARETRKGKPRAIFLLLNFAVQCAALERGIVLHFFNLFKLFARIA